MFLFTISTILWCTSSVTNCHVIKEKYNFDKYGYPTFDSTPNDVFITFLGPEYTSELEKHDFSDNAVEVVVRKVFTEADTNRDGLLDKHELASWIDKLDKINSAVEIKQVFMGADIDKDGFISFVDYAEHATDIPTREEFQNKFMVGEIVNFPKLNSTSEPQLEKDGIPNLGYMIQQNYQLWLLADTNKDGKLDWDEFIVFSHPDEFDETYTHVTGSKYKEFDDNKDEKYSLKEFENYYSDKVLIPELLPAHLREPADLFANCDTDGDSYLSYQEGDQCMRSVIAVNHDNIEWLLLDTDLNEDGKLSEDEVVQSFEQLITSDDYFYRHDEL